MRQGREPAPFAFSLAVHMSALAWVAFGPSAAAPRKQQTLYEREIAPHEKKLVWYRFNEKLPDVSAQQPALAVPAPRGEVKSARQTIVSRSPTKDRAQQMTLAPLPELKAQPELAAPNLMAFEAPKAPPRTAPKLFAPPPERPKPEQPALESAPEMAIAANRNPLEQLGSQRLPRPEQKKFVPPEEKRADAAKLEPPDARVATDAPKVNLPQALLPGRPKPRAFTPPKEQARRIEPAATLESAPQLAITNEPAPALQARVNLPRPQPKRFTAPETRAGRTAVLESAPELAARASNAAPAGIGTRLVLPRPQPKRFTPPAAAPAEEIELEAAGDVTAAVVGMNPMDRKAPVVPDFSRAAEFSAAPVIAREAAAPTESAPITVAGLSIRNMADPQPKPSIATVAIAAPTSRENLLAAARTTTASRPPVAAAAPAQASGVRVGAAPDPRMAGRVVYTVALQMPNVTSYSGSWIMWYAERARNPGEAPDISPPKPLRKVDPIYDLSAVDDRVEGKVQLSAIIHTDGYVYGIKVLSGVDPRLDNNAVGALRKWEFEPARRDGVPVDVDVVIEIPFRLQPKK